MDYITRDLLGKQLSVDIFSVHGMLLLKKGVRIEESHLENLQKHQYYFDKSFIVDESSPKYVTEKMYGEVNKAVEASFQQFKIRPQSTVKNLTNTFTPFINSIMESTHFGRFVDDVRQYDNYTYLHSMNVGIYSVVIGKILNLSEEEVRLLGLTGLFHDVGKLFIDKNIINKSGKLTEDEWDKMKQHPMLGYNFLKGNAQLHKFVLQGTLLHHEKLDGSGYPLGITKEKIPFLVQIITVADIYDALYSTRSYRKRMNLYVALKILLDEARDGKLNLAIVIPFLYYIMSGKNGQQVTLNTGELAEIVFVHPNEPLQPIVRIGESYIDISKQSNYQIVSIIEMESQSEKKLPE
ncbi:HD-GYP domain-containing protein [Mangrovibacillus cuniculi]|uniref:HD-GYP domain-containing protein n=1 Tax=Mangrovibacillus cuniculi TaxID=2593652 RepID=A0A7S8C9D4_9BACI|nr:HD-GYP domain-containing protein [Mangrovibacillus cuniculi]QPC45643.1 HD-GYP domain-containing protein [Mangrovibacillus cuniculi]